MAGPKPMIAEFDIIHMFGYQDFLFGNDFQRTKYEDLFHVSALTFFYFLEFMLIELHNF